MSETRRARLARIDQRPARVGHGPRDKRRWCRGRIGVQHRYGIWAPGWSLGHGAASGFGRLWAHRICDDCGRIDHFYAHLAT